MDKNIGGKRKAKIAIVERTTFDCSEFAVSDLFVRELAGVKERSFYFKLLRVWRHM